MNPISLIIWLALGALSGWLAGQIVKGHGFGTLGNIVVGILGAVVGGWLFGGMVGSGLLGGIITSVLGAVVLLVVVGFLRKVT